MRLLILPIFILLLAACVSTTPNLTAGQRVFAVKGEFDVALGQATAYASQPRCSDIVVVACSDQAAVDAMITASDDVVVILDRAESAVRANPDSALAGDLATLARDALGAFTTILIREGVLQ